MASSNRGKGMKLNKCSIWRYINMIKGNHRGDEVSRSLKYQVSPENHDSWRYRRKKQSYACVLSHLQLCDPMDWRPQAPVFMGVSWQEYWYGLSFPPSGDLPDPGIETASLKAPALQANSVPVSPQWSPKAVIRTQEKPLVIKRTILYHLKSWIREWPPPAYIPSSPLRTACLWHPDQIQLISKGKGA